MWVSRQSVHTWPRRYLQEGISGLQHLAITDAYHEFLDKVRARDDVSLALIVKLLGAETHRRTDIEAVLAKGP